jgi:hypothetical protein
MLRVRHVLAATALLAACGGRYAHYEEEGGGASGGTSTGTGGSGQGGKKPGGKAGSFSTAGSSSVGGKSTGTAGTAGVLCPDIPCPDIDCAPGYTRQPDPSGCCAVCVPLDCRMVACPGIACGSGSQLIYPPDQCCPICSPGNCEEQRNGYFVYRSAMLEKYNSLGCTYDTDCTLLYDSNACSTGCGGAPIPAAYEKELLVSLESFAAKICGGCPPLPVAPCEPSLPAACVEGRCQTRPFR